MQLSRDLAPFHILQFEHARTQAPDRLLSQTTIAQLDDQLPEAQCQ
jgi:hypothetical protein